MADLLGSGGRRERRASLIVAILKDVASMTRTELLRELARRGDPASESGVQSILVELERRGVATIVRRPGRIGRAVLVYRLTAPAAEAS